jgi:CBS domain-containing protein
LSDEAIHPWVSAPSGGGLRIRFALSGGKVGVYEGDVVKVHELMSSPAVYVGTETPLRRIAELLHEHRISAVPVADASGEVLGVVSQGDLVPKGHKGVRPTSVDERRRSLARVAGEVMTTPAVTVDRDDDLRVAARLMTRHGIGRVPVTSGGHLVGVLSRADVVGAFLCPDDDLKHQIDETLAAKVPADIEDVRISVHDGVVTLEGAVELASTADVIAFHVDRVDGVLCVDNRLTFRIDDELSAESVFPAPVGPIEMIL